MIDLSVRKDIISKTFDVDLKLEHRLGLRSKRNIGLANFEIAKLYFLSSAYFFKVHKATYVGACIDTARVEGIFGWDRVNPNKRLVYCAVGSHGNHWNEENRLRLLESVVEAFRAYPEYQVLLQTLCEDECRRIAPLPDNILTAPWYPKLQILARASVVITHGGFGTVREALFFGVPMIAFPYGVDQPGKPRR